MYYLRDLKGERLKYKQRIQDMDKKFTDAQKAIKNRDALIESLEAREVELKGQIKLTQVGTYINLDLYFWHVNVECSILNVIFGGKTCNCFLTFLHKFWQRGENLPVPGLGETYPSVYTCIPQCQYITRIPAKEH